MNIDHNWEIRVGLCSFWGADVKVQAIELIEDVGSALERARTLAGKDALVVITGSIYLVGEVMRLFGTRI